MNGRFAAAFVGVSLFVVASLAPPALATFPGINGKIAFHSDRDGNYEIYTANFDGTNQTRLTTNSANDFTPNWSPDGKTVSFTTFRDGNLEIYSMKADGSGQTRVTNNPADDAQAAWSPDGTRIAFTSSRDGNYEIYTMDPNGANVVRLTNNASNEGYSSWSPDGTKIAFQTDRSGNMDVWTMNADGTNQVNRSNNAATDEYPDWAPDASKLVFDSNRDGNFEIYQMNPDGTSQARQTNRGGSDIAGGWSPQFSHLYWAGNLDGDSEIINSQFTTTINSSDDNFPDWQPLDGTYARPRGATPVSVPLVPAYKQCTSPVTGHRGSLSAGACYAPSPESSYLTVGTPDYNGVGANSVGTLRIDAYCNGGAAGEQPPCSTTLGDQLDGKITVSITDVRCRATSGGCAGGALSDYTGNLWASIGMRITDKNNGPTGVGPSANGTLNDLALAFTVPCATTAATTAGATCSVTTGIDAVFGGNTAVTEGKRAIWQLTGSGSDIRLLDGGADGVAQTLGDDTLFATAGLFFP
jgi:Tol biopolymer transport system component